MNLEISRHEPLAHPETMKMGYWPPRTYAYFRSRNWGMRHGPAGMCSRVH